MESYFPALSQVNENPVTVRQHDRAVFPGVMPVSRHGSCGCRFCLVNPPPSVNSGGASFKVLCCRSLPHSTLLLSGGLL